VADAGTVRRYSQLTAHLAVPDRDERLPDRLGGSRPPAAAVGGGGRVGPAVFGECGTDWRLKTVTANGQPGFAAFQRVGGGYEPHTLQVFTVTAGGISRNSVFQGSEVFGLAAAFR
jgi:hypothetical protein